MVYLAADVVRLKMNEGGVIGWRGVFMTSLIVLRNHDGVPDAVLNYIWENFNCRGW